MRPATNKLEDERAELDAVLASRILGRTNYLVRLLTFVCEKYFEGETDEIKEYSIAVHALGRSPDFDPQVDTIVRVTAHALRKRLEEYYRKEGADHAVHICLPAGHYVPSFVRRNESTSEENGTKLTGEIAAPPQGDLPESQERYSSPPLDTVPPGENVLRVSPRTDTADSKQIFTVSGLLVLLGIMALVGFLVWPRKNRPSPITQAQAAAPAPAMAPVAAPAPIESSPVVRAMVGDGRKPYTDQAGFLWGSDRFCTGGDSFSATRPAFAGMPQGAIQGTSDAPLFWGGRHGVFQCGFPVTPGVYEVHLLFAETTGLQENARHVDFSINGGPSNSLDVVDDAGGDDAATTKVFTDVEPTNDGKIHVDFTTPDSFLNAVEIVPGAAQHTVPIRIITGRSVAYRDSAGILWLPDRDYFGGRPSQVGTDVSSLPDSGVYDGQRIGHFHYSIPVVAGRLYTLKLHFIERWFGIENRNVGGVGSRVFDVSCNGSVLLKNFDIMREAAGTPLIKSFPHIEPTPQGKIEIYFTPAVNYPSISAIEVLPE